MLVGDWLLGLVWSSSQDSSPPDWSRGYVRSVRVDLGDVTEEDQGVVGLGRVRPRSEVVPVLGVAGLRSCEGVRVRLAAHDGCNGNDEQTG